MECPVEFQKISPFSRARAQVKIWMCARTVFLMTDALIFDLDGTLVDTFAANHAAYAQAFAEFGVSLNMLALKGVFGLRIEAWIGVVAPDFDLRDLAQLKARKAYYYQHALAQLQPNHRLIAFLKKHKPTQRIGLVTSAGAENAQAVLRQCDLVDAFDACVFGDDVHHGKPDPAGYLECLRRLRVSAANALAFEDSAWGIEAAQRAGIRVVRVSMQP